MEDGLVVLGPMGKILALYVDAFPFVLRRLLLRALRGSLDE